MSNDELTNILKIVLIVMLGILFFLIFVFAILKIREASQRNKKENLVTNNAKTGKGKGNMEYSKQSIFSFMKFDKIEDDMIIRKNGTKYLMVVECQGVNYDLMSGIEKNSVEQGFLQFLNTLKHPIQL